jgi:hypothetical protein
MVPESSHILVVAPAEVDGAALREELERHCAADRIEVRLVAPAVTASKFKHAFGDVDDAIVAAQRRLEESMQKLRGGRLEVQGQVGDSDPLIAAEDALGSFAADEMLIVTHSGEEAEWFERDLFDEAAERFEPPITHVVLDGANGNRGLAEVEHSGPGVPGGGTAADEMELGENLPPFSRWDLAGMVVAIVGTIVLALLAASPPGGVDSFAGATRILIAIAFALINMAHVVGLLFFSSQRYRGPGRTLFRALSLLGTPTAIVVSLLLGLT